MILPLESHSVKAKCGRVKSPCKGHQETIHARGMKEVKLGHGGDSKILDMPKHQDICQEELHTGNAASPRQRYYVESNKVRELEPYKSFKTEVPDTGQAELEDLGLP